MDAGVWVFGGGLAEDASMLSPPTSCTAGSGLWVEERIAGLRGSDDGRSLFVEGCVRNQSKFYDRFDAVVLLSAPADVILDRVAPERRPDTGRLQWNGR